jgi:hypothetical protein
MKEEHVEKGISEGYIYTLGRWKVKSQPYQDRGGVSRMRFIVGYDNPTEGGGMEWKEVDTIPFPGYKSGPTLRAFLWEMFYHMAG